MKNLILTFVAVYTALALAACGDDGGGGGGAVIVNPVGCQAPNYLNSYGQCLGPNGQIINTSQARFGASNCQSANTSCANDPNFFEVTNSAVYQDFLEKGLGVCSSRYSSGYYDCKSWWPGKFDIVVTANTNVAANQYCSAKGLTVPSTASVYVRAAYVAQGYFQYGATLGLGYPYNNGMTHEGSVNVINDCKGFEIRKTMNRYLFQVVVKNGNLSGNSINYELVWGSPDVAGNVGTVFARGVMYRY